MSAASSSADVRAQAIPPCPASCVLTGRVLVLGLGNSVLSDDAVGLHAAREVAKRLAVDEGIEVELTEEMGLALLDTIVGYAGLVLVDAIHTGEDPVGTIREVDQDSLARLPAMGPHFLGVGETLALGRLLGLSMPQSVRILAMEVADPWTLGTDLTPAVAVALPALIERTMAAAQAMAESPVGCG